MVDPSRLKLCRHCRERKPIRNFDHPRHRICSQCRRDEATVRTGFSVTAGVITPHNNYARAQLYYNSKDNLPLTTGLTVGMSARNKYHRDRARRIAAAKRAADAQERERLGLPMKVRQLPADTFIIGPNGTTRPLPLKWCRYCQRNLDMLKFASPHVRICMECDGPELGM